MRWENNVAKLIVTDVLTIALSLDIMVVYDRQREKLPINGRSEKPRIREGRASLRPTSVDRIS